MSKQEAREENLMELGRANISPRDARRFQAIARSLHRLDEAACNYGLSERQETREERLEQEATMLAERYGFTLYVQGDPRGWPLYLLTPEIAAKGEGYYTEGMAVCPH